MSPSSQNRTVTFVTLAALLALSGCDTAAHPSSLAQSSSIAREISFSRGLALAPSPDFSLYGVAARLVDSPARRTVAAATLVVGADACQSDADCVPDGCHATSCVAAAELAPGELELECTAELRYGTTDGGGCLCHVGHCAARLSSPPQGI